MTIAAANTVTTTTFALPISWNMFLNAGATCYDNPPYTKNMGVAISCSSTQVTIGVKGPDTGIMYMRYVVFGK